jgi:trans-aconitate methyltransferase
MDEIREALRVYKPKTVLEVGCGWGRVMEHLANEFSIFGCDVSNDMLREAASLGLRVFKFDLAAKCTSTPDTKYDVIFSRGVLHYVLEPLYLLENAVVNLKRLAGKKILIFEYPEVCRAIRKIDSNDLFEFHPIQHLEE